MATVQELIEKLESLTEAEKLLPVAIFDHEMEYNNKIVIKISIEDYELDDDDDISEPEVILVGGDGQDKAGISVLRRNRNDDDEEE